MNVSNSLLLASVIAALLVGLQCAKIPHEQCPWPVDLCVWMYMVFALCGFICEAYIGRTSPLYAKVYFWAMIPVTTAALGLSMYALNKSRLHIAMVAEFFLFVMLAAQIGSKYADWPRQNKMIFYVAISFTASGLFLLLSLDKLTGGVWDDARMTLGLFLLSFGLLHWMLPERFHFEHETTHSIARTASMTHWVPAFLAIGAFCFLGWIFSQAKVTP